MADSIIADVSAHGNKRLIYGVGSNDFPGKVSESGKLFKSYSTWHGILERSYSAIYHARFPTYIGCSVAEEWLSFSNFERYYIKNHFGCAHLDKDILIPGNKLYGPDTCVFISPMLNNLLLTKGSCRGICPLGVTFTRGKYHASVSENGCNRHLGSFPTALLAHQAWQRAKLQIIADFPTADPRIRAALDLRVAQLRDGLLHGRITVTL